MRRLRTARAGAGGGERAESHSRVEAVLRDHRATLLWIARRWTGSAEDAEDAFQRALEIYVRRLDAIEPATELGWLKVVVRHEAMALQRARTYGVDADIDERIPAPDLAVQERIEREERTARSREAMARLKPDERTALLLKAEGYSYREIGERQGWTYTKVNRAITEGRRRFLQVFASIEAGDECERLAPTLEALVAGHAESSAVVELRPHLRHCASCRATVRELVARRHRLALHLPVLAGITPLRWLGDRVADGAEPTTGGWPDLKGAASAALNRLGGPDTATGMQLASSGGGRGTAVAALVGLCLTGGAGTYCAATGVFPDPTRIVWDDERKSEPRRKPQRDAPGGKQKARATPQSVTRSPVIHPAATASTSTTTSPVRDDPARRREPKRRNRSDPTPEFGFEGTTGTPGATARAPADDQPVTARAASTQPSNSNDSSMPSSSPPPTSGGEFLP